jgi:hypothetical protein
MTDRETLEARATELGIQFTDGWKDSTLENRIAAQEQKDAENNSSAITSDVDKGKVPGPAQKDVQDGSETDETTASKPEKSDLLAAVEALEGKPMPHSPDTTATTLNSTGQITVTGPANGRWRIGKYFTRETQTFELADLTEEQIAALEADPELVVSIVRTAPDPA